MSEKLREEPDALLSEYEGVHVSNIRFFLSDRKTYTASLCAEVDGKKIIKLGDVTLIRETLTYKVDDLPSGRILAYVYNEHLIGNRYFGSVEGLLKYAAETYSIMV